MTDRLLESIIQLEKQIQANVAEEKVRAEQWQDRELATLQKVLAKTLAEEETRLKEMLAEKRSELLQEGADLEAAADDWCQRLTSLEDTKLREVLLRHLTTILPGGDHDHPHGQG